MNRPPQAPEPPPPGRALAGTALFFSLLACAMSGYVLVATYDEGRLVKNFKLIMEDTSRALGRARKNIEEKKGEGLEWGKIRERIDRIETMVRSKDGRASYYIDVLKTDLELLRDYTSEKGSTAVSKTLEGLEAARGRLSEDAAGAAERLKQLSKEIAPKAKASPAPEAKQEKDEKTSDKGAKDSTEKPAAKSRGTEE